MVMPYLAENVGWQGEVVEAALVCERAQVDNRVANSGRRTPLAGSRRAVDAKGHICQ